jgi:hypothetical protein
MKSVEMYFNDTIAEYSHFKHAATMLIQEIPSLPPSEINQRCAELSSMIRAITDNKSHLFDLMEFMGLGILDTSYIGEFQRVLDKSILACDTLYADLLTYKDAFTSCPE